jgi:hypothetical protein
MPQQPFTGSSHFLVTAPQRDYHQFDGNARSPQEKIDYSSMCGHVEHHRVSTGASTALRHPTFVGVPLVWTMACLLSTATKDDGRR